MFDSRLGLAHGVARFWIIELKLGNIWSFLLIIINCKLSNVAKAHYNITVCYLLRLAHLLS